MSRFKGSFTVKLNVSASIKKETKIKLPLLVIKSGIFPDARHYAKNITAVNLYAVLLYGTRDGRIPSRNVLEFLNKYVEDNKNNFVGMYLKNRDDIMNAGTIIGTDINNKHKSLIYGFKSPGNAPSTIKQKGFNDPLIDTGTLVKSIAFSINGKGRYGRG